ncbi:hypothetical protein HYC85_018825 [Camellia sinensis]|uniref:Squalene cyclase N-terminal domain-containing protein n=1 Tax=Camellia sinensis TaxID=4442 RepID=A0A7J7GZ85_CAMSI|nr:hypothetical protein HYC85_018825 [Camellia sinensis]
MWKLKIAEGRGPYLFSTTIMLVDKFGSLTLMQGRQKSEHQLKKHEKNIKRNAKKNELGLYPLKKENNNIDLSIPPVRLGEKEVTHEAATIALRKAIRLNRVIQASDGHWAAENAGPMFFTPTLVSVLSNFAGCWESMNGPDATHCPQNSGFSLHFHLATQRLTQFSSPKVMETLTRCQRPRVRHCQSCLGSGAWVRSGKTLFNNGGPAAPPSSKPPKNFKNNLLEPQ